MYWLLPVLLEICLGITTSQQQEPSCYNRFEYEFDVIQKLVQLEERSKKQEEYVASIHKQLTDAENKISELHQALTTFVKTSDGTTYVRWGRTTCPEGATLVYHGYVGGAHYTHSGSAANTLCLHPEPLWNEYINGSQTGDYLYGAEYQTGRNVCDSDYRLEYSGYLMTEHYTHASNTDYVCMDAIPETVDAGYEGKGGKYFYFVQASCGSLRCPPYVSGREVTCAVCSYSPDDVSVNQSVPLA